MKKIKKKSLKIISLKNKGKKITEQDKKKKI
jgi:hypothetical protein